MYISGYEEQRKDVLCKCLCVCDDDEKVGKKICMNLGKLFEGCFIFVLNID